MINLEIVAMASFGHSSTTFFGDANVLRLARPSCFQKLSELCRLMRLTRLLRMARQDMSLSADALPGSFGSSVFCLNS